MTQLANIRSVGVDGAPIPSGTPPAERLLQSVSRVLGSTPLAAWATVAASGRAHVNTGYFAFSDALHLYLLSHPGSLHCRNIAVNPSMAVAVFASAQNWADPGRGIQLFGTCAPVSEADAAEAERAYAQRFPAYAEWKRTLESGNPALEYRFYRFVTERMKVLDEAEFGDGVFVEARVSRA
jgi:uncharacterized protein YhbP (UPF0306 family)